MKLKMTKLSKNISDCDENDSKERNFDSINLNFLAYARKLRFLFLCAGFIFVMSGCANEAGPVSEIQKSGSQKKTEFLEKNDASQRSVKILFVGDMMFDRYIRTAVGKYGKGDYDYILEPVKNMLAGYDLVVGNLEGPITDGRSSSIGTEMNEKRNLVFTFDPAVAKTLAGNNIKLVNLGNNHILNQGEAGLAQTKKYLNEAGVGHFGDTGDGEQEFLIREINGIKAGFVNYNYSIAGSFEKAIEDAKSTKKKSDVVIVCPHWGTEYKTGDPGNQTRELARKFIDAGADAVIGTHPHVVQTNEEYKSKKIYYSLGNFVFDQYFQKETMEGLGVELTINPDFSLQYGEMKFAMNKRGQTTVINE